MSESLPSIGAAPVPLIGEWQGPAANNPALAGDEKTLEGFLAGTGDLSNAALWVGVTIGFAILQDASDFLAKPKVVAFLTAWRQRHGQAKLEDLKGQVLDVLKHGKVGVELTPEVRRRRVDALFDPLST